MWSPRAHFYTHPVQINPFVVRVGLILALKTVERSQPKKSVSKSIVVLSFSEHTLTIYMRFLLLLESFAERHKVVEADDHTSESLTYIY